MVSVRRYRQVSSPTTSMLTISTLISCSGLFDSSLLFAVSDNRPCKKKVVCRNFRQTTQHGTLEGKTQSLQSASQKVQKLSEIQECLAKKLAKSVYFSLFNSEIEWNIRENRFFSNFSTKPQFLYEGAIFLRKFNIKN